MENKKIKQLVLSIGIFAATGFYVVSNIHLVFIICMLSMIGLFIEVKK